MRCSLVKEFLKIETKYRVDQLDIYVIGGPLSLDDAGCMGILDLVVAILSPGNNRKVSKNKFEVYE